MPEGWYPDPDGHGSMRLWDGQKWTRQRRKATEAELDVAQPAPPSSHPGGPPAGWMLDATDPTQERWWDGAAFTDHVRAAGTVSVTPSTTPENPSAPGWYQDPKRPEGWRWWDGRMWTKQHRTGGPIPTRPGRLPRAGSGGVSQGFNIGCGLFLFFFVFLPLVLLGGCAALIDGSNPSLILSLPEGF